MVLRSLTAFTFIFYYFGLTIAYADPALENELFAPDITCKIIQSDYDYGYCIHRVKESASHEVLYYLHGAGSSEYEWQALAKQYKIYDSFGANAPVVISISYGSIWMLNESTSTHRGLFEHFVNVVMPDTEKLLDFKPTKRSLVGLSMGGFNASQLYLKDPALFQKVAFLCPALTTVGPYSSNADISAYVDRTQANWNAVNRALLISRRYYPTPAAWAKADPIALSASLVNQAFPPVFVSVGSEDEYGFDEGARTFAENVAKKGVNTQYALVAGYHCSFDIPKALAFFNAN